ncbi:MAG: haloacid dehalogenase, type II [SAR202 cluster bacterium Io17-Chloro-G6]|nr:MAG: haloacid dehalogenase, type II [SAR202 cluster bacterium Io17-Chloro-G6]
MTSAALGDIRAITLDMYGTLLDLETGFAQGFGRFLKSKGSSRHAAEVIQIWEAVYLRESMVDTMLGRGRTLFEKVRRECLSQVFSSLHVDHKPEDIERLLTTDAQVSLFPDVQEGVSALREKFTVSVLSNGDLDSLDRAISGLSIPVHKVISAEQAGAYKPHSVVYRTATEQLNLQPSQILHVAAHTWDIRGAKAFGFMGAYLNRDNIPYGGGFPQADLEITTLTELAEILGV